jgi:peptidoglycan/xylan/chitin deacetylase (PgdA/CDA1 family)
MSRRNTKLFKAALSAFHYTGADGALAPFTSGSGVIFTLHHVRPEPPQDFEPNRILKITPDFLESVIKTVIEGGFEILTLDEVAARLQDNTPDAKHRRPFACFTFDDGYRDNRDFALPVFRKYGVPFTLFVPTDFPEGNGELWWLTLEDVLRTARALTLEKNGRRVSYVTETVAQKDAAFHEIYWWLRSLPENQAREIVRRLASENGIDSTKLCRDLIMTWDELREVARDPLITIGAHTRSHFALAKLSDEDARAEIFDSVMRIEKEFGRPCHHFSYPYGDETSAGAREFAIARDLGLTTAVTTRKGLVYAGHASQLTALPRLSLNGDFQNSRYLKVMLTGAPFVMWDAVRRLTGARQAA